MNVTIHEAKTNLSRLIREALHGEEVIISKGSKPVVKITPLEAAYPKRSLGGGAGVIQFMPEDFNDEVEDFDEE